LVDRTVQPSVFAAFECVHGDQHGAPAVLALVSRFAFPLLAAALAATAPAVPLALAAAGLGPPRAATFGQLLGGGGGDSVAVALDDEHVAVPFGQWAAAEVGSGGPAQPHDPALDGRGSRRPVQEHAAHLTGEAEAQSCRQSAEATDQPRTE